MVLSKLAEKANQAATRHLAETHRKIVDSIQQIDTGSSSMVYQEILEERAAALLMDEEAMTYFKDELKIFPRKNVLYAVSYFMKLLGILLK